MQIKETLTAAPEGMRVSVLVPTFNRANYIAECLDSLLAQTMPALEIIVIDDGSEDGTADLLRGYGQRIRYIRKDNGGKPTAVNLGLSLAQGELIWIFDDDDVALPSAIADRVAVLQNNPGAGFVYAPHFYGSDGQNGKIQQGRLHTLAPHNPENFLYELMKGCFFHLATALVRADVYRAVGGFDTSLLSSEDYDMQARLISKVPAVYCPQAIFIFRQHTGLRGAKNIRYSGNNRTKVFRAFDERVGQKLRASLKLGDYLVPRQSGPLSQNDRRQALLARMTVMASKGCISEMLIDLRDYLIELPKNDLPSHQEQQLITQAVCTGYASDAISDQWSEFSKTIEKLPKTKSGKIVKKSLSSGFLKLGKSYPGNLRKRMHRLKQALQIFINSL